MIGKKHQGALLGFVPDLDAAQEQMACALAGQLIEKDDFVALDGTTLGYGTTLQDAIVGVVFHASDEVDAVGVERGEPGVVGVAAIQDHDGARLEAQGAGHAALVHAAFGHQGIAGQQSLMIEQQMQLHRALRAAVLRPVEDGGAEFDEGGVQSQQFVLEAESLLSG